MWWFFFSLFRCFKKVYVDAVTGEVRDYNPAFPKDKQLNYAFSW